jgi:hypothetical protein
MIYAYADKRTGQVAMICQGQIEQTAFDEFEFSATDPAYLQYLQTGGNLYVINGKLTLM